MNPNDAGRNAALLVILGIICIAVGIAMLFGPGYAVITFGVALVLIGGAAWWVSIKRRTTARDQS